MRTIVHADPFSMITALEKLDLSVPILHRAVESGYLAKANATPNHPPLYPSFVAWGDTICSLRNELIPRGWSKTNERNWPRVIHPSGEIALTVATGNEHTGSPNFMPATKSTKGPSTIQAIEINRNQGWLPWKSWMMNNQLHGYFLFILHKMKFVVNYLYLFLQMKRDVLFCGVKEYCYHLFRLILKL